VDAPVLEAIKGSDRRWRTVGDWRGHGVTIPHGFVTDLASFPRLVEPFLHRNWWHWVISGLVHDFAYRTHLGKRRKAADDLMRRVAVAEGAPRWQAWIVWASVRLFGRTAWENYRR
jgi:hypothetical protein